MNIYEKSGSVRLRVQVQPRASRSEVAGEYGDRIKVRIAAPPAEGEANAELIRFFARLLGIAASRVTVVSGAGSRQKVVAISGIDVNTVAGAIESALKSR